MNEVNPETTPISPEKIKDSRRKFLMLVAIAFVPIFIAAGLFFYFPAVIPSATTNQGRLITPPLEASTIAPELGEIGSWVLIYQSTDSECDETCQQVLYTSRQIIAGLGKEKGRVDRVILSKQAPTGPFAELLSVEHGDITVITSETAESLLALGDENSKPVLFLKDPNGNIMMYYTAEKVGMPLRKDLKHLLKVSNIG